MMFERSAVWYAGRVKAHASLLGLLRGEDMQDTHAPKGAARDTSGVVTGPRRMFDRPDLTTGIQGTLRAGRDRPFAERHAGPIGADVQRAGS